MEQILAKLIEPDSASITEGTKELQEALKRPESIGELCNTVVFSQNTSIRHYAAVVLRKKLSKTVNWNKVTQNDREIIKNGMLKALVDEPEKQVKTAICQFVAHIANHELPNNNWPQLIQLLEGLNTSNDLSQRELGMYALGIILEICDQSFKKPDEKANMCNLFNSTLESIPDMSEPLAYLTVVAMHQYLIATEDCNLDYNWKKVFETVEAQAKKRPDRALECLDMIDNLMEMDDLKPEHVDIADVYLLVLHLAEHSEDDDLQEKTLNVLSTVIKAKLKSTFYTKNNNLLDKSIEVLLKLMSAPPLDDASEEYYIDNDANSPSVYAASVMDDMAIHIGPSKLMNSLHEKLVLYLRSEDKYQRKAGYLALAAITEGASSYIQKNVISAFVDFAVNGITDAEVVVQNAALFALGQMSEYLQPEISLYANQVMPILLNYLNHVANSQVSPENTKNIERMFYALQSYIDTMEQAAQPFVQTLMEANVKIMENPNFALELKEQAIQTIGSIATAIKTEFLPYFAPIMTHLAACINAKDLKGSGDDYRVSTFQNAAVEIIGTLARAVGEENFRPYAVQSIELGLRMVNDTVDDPDTMKVVFQLFASVSTILKQEMIYLPNIVELTLNAIENDNEYVAQMKESPDLDIFVGEEDNEDEATYEEEDIDFDESRSDDDDDQVEGYTYDCAKLDEKEEALNTIRELAEVTGPSFQPYLQKCFDAVFKTLYHPHSGIRQLAIDTLVQLCVAQPVEADQIKCLEMIVPKLREIIKTDDDKDVVISALGGFRDLLTKVGAQTVATPGHLEAIHNTLKDVLVRKTECQDNSSEEDEEEEDAEKDGSVIESAGDILPALSKVIPPHMFERVFKDVLNHLMLPLKKSTGSNLEALQAFTVGTIAECIPGLGDFISDFIPTFLPLLMKGCKHQSSEMKQNSVYGLGILASAAKQSFVPHYPQILGQFHEVLLKDQSGAVVDNVVAAICRLILVSPTGVPLETVLPMLMDNLPLKEDLDETHTVLECLCVLYNNGDSTLLKHLAHILKICVFMLNDEARYLSKNNSKDLTLYLLSNIIKHFPADCDAALSGVPPEQLAVYEAVKKNVTS